MQGLSQLNKAVLQRPEMHLIIVVQIDVVVVYRHTIGMGQEL